MKKLAYLILVPKEHKPDHFAELIEILNYNCDIYIYVDSRTDIAPFKAAAKGKNIFFIEKRIAMHHWFGISIVDIRLALIKEAIKKKDEYTHLVFLSGACYPIKPMKEIHSKLTDNPNKEYIKLVDLSNNNLKRINKKYFYSSFFSSQNKLVCFIDVTLRTILRGLNLKNKWKDEMTAYFGSEWFAITTSCSQYILDFLKDNPWYRKMNKDTSKVTEHFFHTIIGNSRFKEAAGGVYPYEGYHIYKYANLHLLYQYLGKFVTIDDWDDIATSDKLFVRKFRSIDRLPIISKINAEIHKMNINKE